MDKVEERLAYEDIGMVDEVVCENGVEVDEAEVGGEQGPVWRGRGGSGRGGR